MCVGVSQSINCGLLGVKAAAVTTTEEWVLGDFQLSLTYQAFGLLQSNTVFIKQIITVHRIR